MSKITQGEKQALYQYTMGDAYATINALLYEGMDNELAKKMEGKKIFMEDKQMLKNYLNMIILMYSAMYKKYKASPYQSVVYTRRIDRMSTFKEYSERGVILSNLSTTKNDFLLEYAISKKNPVFLELKLLPGVLYADMEDILEAEYEKLNEAEVLIAPFSKIVQINDITKNSEIPKYELVLEKGILTKISVAELANLEKEIYDNFFDCKQIMDKIGLSGLTQNEVKMYCTWKKSIKRFVMGKCKEVELLLDEEQ